MEEDNKPTEDSCIAACDVLENGSKSISEESAQVTKEMVEEEERVYRAALAEEKVVRQKFMADLQTLQRDNFYFHLKNLLDRSFWYTSSLHRRIMEENEQETSKNTGKETNEISSGKEQGISEQVVPGKSVQGGGSEEGRGSERNERSEPQQSQTVPPGSDPSSFCRMIPQNCHLLGSSVGRTPHYQRRLFGGVYNLKSLNLHHKILLYFQIIQDAEKNRRKRIASQQSSDDNTIKCDSSQSTTAEWSELSLPPQLNCNSQNGGPVSVHRQPVLVTGGTLRSYQVDGFKWLKTLYENGVNSILADEMGLGKTVQCVALVAELIEGGISGPFLVCAPLSTVANWMSEFATFAPKIPCILYHGSKMERLAMQSKIKNKHEVEGHERQTRPVVITSYEIAMNDQSMLRTNSFSLMIVDEGHRIKNRQCKLIKVLNTFDSTHRLLLTGTPLQNNLSELWSLLNFLIPEIFDNLGSFQAWFDVEFLATAEDAHEQIIQEEQRKSTLNMLHKILTPFMLRRLKCDVDFVIPPKKELLVFASLAPRQREMYEAIVNRTIVHLLEPNKVEKVDEPVEMDAKGRPVRRVRKKSLDLKLLYKSELSRRENDDDILRWAEAVQHSDELEDIPTEDVVEKPKSDVPIVRLQLRNLLALLRNCCNHPYLIEFPIENDEYRIDEDIVTTSGKLLLLDRILFELKKRGHKVLIFSQSTQMLNVLEHYCYLRQHCFCRLDGTMSLTDRRLQISRFADDDVFLFLLSTRAGGLGINLTSADTVIIYDSDWNPQCDLQAQDRCHRIGQTRPVVVYRLVTANTVDQQIVERATAKRTLERLVIHKENFKSASNSFAYQNKPLSPEELLAILKETDYKKFAEKSKDRTINDEDLELLLDRSDLHEIWKKRLEGEPVVCEKLSPNGRQGLFQVLADVSEQKE